MNQGTKNKPRQRFCGANFTCQIQIAGEIKYKARNCETEEMLMDDEPIPFRKKEKKKEREKNWKE